MKKFNFLVCILALVMVFGNISGADSSEIFVDACENSLTGGTPLDTGIIVKYGSFLDIETGFWYWWRLGGLGDQQCNAGGLHNPFGGNYGEYKDKNSGSSFLYGSLVGRIGSGDYFYIGYSYHGMAQAEGNLQLICWDCDAYNNSGKIGLTVTNYSVSPSHDPFPLLPIYKPITSLTNDSSPMMLSSSSVPLPSTVLLFGSGLTGLIVLRKFRGGLTFISKKIYKEI